jgi:uncharacterized protein
MRLTEAEARRVLLGAQGLLLPPDLPASKQDVLECIRRMAVLQIDTIHVVARSPYFVLWSRLGSYDPAWLDELLAEGALFEYWSHAACFLPIEEYALYRGAMLGERRRAAAWLEANHEVAAAVMTRVREGGEVRSIHFERTDGRKGGWWEWKPEKHALECLFSTGELMIARRENFQRVYDLRERVLPGWEDVNTLTTEDVQRTFACKAVKALGVTRAEWVPDYFRVPKRGIATLLDTLVAAGTLHHIEVDGWGEPGYIHTDNLKLAEDIAAGRLHPSVTTLLSPFDPVVWDRARVAALFGFDYKIEVYTPAPKRRYGYFSLPILHRDALVGRLDAKAHRKAGIFEVRMAHLEPGIAPTDDLVHALATTLQNCAAWHGTPQVTVSGSDPPRLAEELRGVLTQSSETEQYSR